MNPSKQRFFIALVPPPDLQNHITQIKLYFAEHYNSRGALNSPPHITLQPTFEWPAADVPKLEESLKRFSANRQPIPVTLSGFAAFAPRVIYAGVVKSPQLLEMQTDLMSYVAAKLGIVDRISQTRPFVPHMTVAFRDLTKENFQTAWLESAARELHFEFTAAELTLLVHDGSRWNISQQFPLGAEPATIINQF
ncbi:MAG: 2'-5' RNA ligase family protein [Microcoleus sp. PH2017_10_PVI_O_A]|uniref:2'-5' RNA ligase family protein n=1 Tax=unclassified Microcoleus TaxID=2642155 RepID=UPI001E17D2DC|nr:MULTISPECIES: 2'-5' RNA ligase family protein [unclassified Microcoleus]TAE81549.1 MAG: 2'-5' RNA ligase family protein [Oscillatoriales cyanobacterium]MCC3404938.1 2'-5' RNA ligase family protein [Microcoleus sp. PH2017_10_PVI_O_A]MCC3461161.1 2'-5' RNA ligase family protein [Microcoleus sp. PH2017_11_PCY_U_A]MCC3479133.1 2'-5' RNA ligase family protein [Microcoleus sp. PH2017_12_PCY_D_A]MCC3527309.1 2'-5' RNA ligase family protein [Microcoleus sp. PH2017_21_RUC_O_A]